MARDAQVPIFLWVATAALVHIVGGFEAEKVAEVFESQAKVRRFAQSVMQHVKRENTTLEVSLMDSAELERQITVVDEGAVDPEQPEAADEPEVERSERDRDSQDAPQRDEPNETVEKPPEPPPEVPKKKEDPKVAQVTLVPTHEERRIAVQQHVEDPNQADNPDAQHIAEHANHVEKETQARITSTDQNAPSPSPGTNLSPPADTPGNARLSEVGQADDTTGDPERPAAESPEAGRDQEVQAAESGARGGNLQGGEPARMSRGDVVESQRQATPESKGQRERAAQASSVESPELLESSSGREFVLRPSEAREGQTARRAVKEQKRTPAARKSPDLRGFGSMNTTRGGLDPNLDHVAAATVIGADQLTRERLADGERRRSKHRGSWTTVGLEKWRSAIENYVASVQPGNQTALNTARSPFASYLNKIHLRIHPEFADDFLNSLDDLPSEHPLNRRDLRTALEIVLSREDGRLVRMGVTRASGNTAFDVAALESVQRAAPFGTPPGEIVSPDGNVYLHWEFWREKDYACSTYNARPYLLRVAPTPAPSPDPPAPPPDDPERVPATGERHGGRSVTKTHPDG